MTLIKIPMPGSTANVELYISAETDSEEASVSPELEDVLCKRLEVAVGKEIQRFLEAAGFRSTLRTDGSEGR